MKKHQEQQVPRGKKNKLKKIKDKYADQDEEEREMRLALLGAKEVKNFDLKKHQEKMKFSDLNSVNESRKKQVSQYRRL